MSRRWIAVGAVALVLAALRAALPVAVARTVEWQGELTLGRDVDVVDVDLSLLSGRAAVHGLTIGEPLTGPQGGGPLLSVRQLDVNIDVLGLLSPGRIRIEGAKAIGSELRLLLLDDGTLAPWRIAEPTDEPTEPEPRSDPPSEAWPLFVDRLVVRDHATLLDIAGEGERPPLEFALESLQLEDLAFLPEEIRVGPVAIRGPTLRVRRDIQLAAPAAPAEPEGDAEETPKAPASDPARSVRAANVTIENAEFAVLLEEGELELRLDFSARDLTLEPGARFPVEVRVGRKTGGEIRITGEAGLSPAAFDGRVEWSDLSLPRVLEAASGETPARISSGFTSGALEVEALASEPPNLKLGGHLSVAELETHAVGVERSLSAHSLKLVLEGLDLAGRKLSLARLGLESEGLVIRDRSVTPEFELSLHELTGKATALRWPERSLDLDLSLRGVTGVDAAVAAQIQSGSGASKLKLASVLLPELNGYAKDAGLRFAEGVASLEGTVQSAGGHHDVDLDVTIQRLALDELEPGVFVRSFGMSTDLALALLQDPSGRIRLPLRFEIKEGGSDVSLTSLWVGAVRQALMGIATTPLKGLGFAWSAVVRDDGGLELEPVPFDPGRRKLGEEQAGYLAALNAALETRPQFALELSGCASVAEEPDPDARRELAHRRAESVQRKLLDDGMNPARLRLGEARDSEPGVALELIPAAD